MFLSLMRSLRGDAFSLVLLAALRVVLRAFRRLP
jgi:hypothetical protein